MHILVQFVLTFMYPIVIIVSYISGYRGVAQFG